MSDETTGWTRKPIGYYKIIRTTTYWVIKNGYRWDVKMGHFRGNNRIDRCGLFAAAKIAAHRHAEGGE